MDLLKELASLDKTTLEGSDQYAEYFRYIQDAFSRLLDSYKQRAAYGMGDQAPRSQDPLEIKIVKGYLESFLRTVEAFRMKYLCEPDRKLRLDPTDSSFPNHIEFRELNSDIQQREARLKELPTEKVLKQSILDFLYKHKESPQELLKQLGRRKYNTMLSLHLGMGSGLFREFTPGKLILFPEPAPSGNRNFLYSWGSYDVLTNRPHVYLLFFEQEKGELSLSKDEEKAAIFIDTIRRSTNNTAPLKVIAHDIDEKFPGYYPKVLKRIDIGPLHGKYSMDDHLYSKIVRENYSAADWIFQFNTEIIFSIGEKRTKAFLSKGDLRQIFFVDQSNAECMERHVSEIHHYMLASHPVIQYLNDKHRDRLESLAMPPITFLPQTQGIHGKK